MQNSTYPPRFSRRQALQTLIVAAATAIALPFRRASSATSSGAAAPGSAASGTQAPHLDVKDSAAAAVGYVEDAAQVDAKKYPAYSQGSSCANCLQLQGTDGAAYRPCTLFPGKLVATAGWCSAWTAEI
jgi:hypothetical protein